MLQNLLQGAQNKLVKMSTWREVCNNIASGKEPSNCLNLVFQGLLFEVCAHMCARAHTCTRTYTHACVRAHTHAPGVMPTNTKIESLHSINLHNLTGQFVWSSHYNTSAVDFIL